MNWRIGVQRIRTDCVARTPGAAYAMANGAEAFKAGRLGVMDYYRLQNIQADTGMRSAIAGDGAGKEPPTREREA